MESPLPKIPEISYQQYMNMKENKPMIRPGVGIITNNTIPNQLYNDNKDSLDTLFMQMQQNDGFDINVDQQFRNGGSLINDNFVRRDEMQLPYSVGSRRTFVNPNLYMIPETTQVSRSCFNEALNNSGQFYLRWWTPFDNAPFLPSNGDTDKDPRYLGVQTKSFTSEYLPLK